MELANNHFEGVGAAAHLAPCWRVSKFNKNEIQLLVNDWKITLENIGTRTRGKEQLWMDRFLRDRFLALRPISCHPF
jgi:hypothetical protein